MISWLDIVDRPAGARGRSPSRCCSSAAPLGRSPHPPARHVGAGRRRVLLPRRPRGGAPPDPLFAYYYIWFNASSWNRAKIDYPLLGRYSSDDRGVMRAHVAWAKQAGIDGFIVSWKSTPVLNRRLGG